MLRWIGVEFDRPLVTQVSRFDPWKDPLGVIAAYRLARERRPEPAAGARRLDGLDDPEGWEIYGEIERGQQEDPGSISSRISPASATSR